MYWLRHMHPICKIIYKWEAARWQISRKPCPIRTTLLVKKKKKKKVNKKVITLRPKSWADPGLISQHPPGGSLPTFPISSSKGFNTLFSLSWPLHTCSIHMYMQALTCIHKIKEKHWKGEQDMDRAVSFRIK